MASRDLTINQLAEVKQGLLSRPKYLPLWYRYDYTGSILCDKSMEDERYYMHRSEIEILQKRAKEIVGEVPEPRVLMDLGSGNAVKTRFIIEAILENQPTLKYFPVDISAVFLGEICEKLQAKYGEKLQINPVAGDYTDGFDVKRTLQENTLLLWFGSLQSESYDSQLALLKKAASSMSDNDRLLVSLDITEDPAEVECAYGLHESNKNFYLNSLRRLNKEFADGKLDEKLFQLKFEYVQNLTEDQTSFTRPHFVSMCNQNYKFPDLDADVSFCPGEPIYLSDWQGVSHKYTEDQLTYIAKTGGHSVTRTWADTRRHVLFASLQACLSQDPENK